MIHSSNCSPYSGNTRFLSLSRALGMAFAIIVQCCPSQAAPHSQAKVQKAVEKWVRQVTADKRPDAVIERVEPYVRNGTTAAYIVRFTGGGYCLAGADSVLLPVYLYSPNGSYDPANPGCQTILRQIANRLAYVQDLQKKSHPSLKIHKPDLDQRLALWDALSSADSSGSAPGPTMAGSTWLELPLTSHWHQGAPYDASCFVAGPSATDPHVVVGCVATAMSQLMYYWRWPQTGSGSVGGSYTYRSTASTLSARVPFDPGIASTDLSGRLWWSNGWLYLTGLWDDSIYDIASEVSSDPAYRIALRYLYDNIPQTRLASSANLGATTYRWDLMQDEHIAGINPANNAVAELCFHAGLAVDMNYGLEGSGAYDFNVPAALTDHFRYDSDATLGLCDPDRMVEEIQWQRPVILCGQGDLGGHCWLIYGYNKGTSPWQFKMNMGWNHSDDWYSLDQIPDGFNDYQTHISRIAPYNVVKFVGADSSGDGSPCSPYTNIEEALTKAASGATLIFKANSLNTFSAGQLTLSRPLTLKGINATIGN